MSGKILCIEFLLINNVYSTKVLVVVQYYDLKTSAVVLEHLKKNCTLNQFLTLDKKLTDKS